jgi:hypothetical protein
VRALTALTTGALLLCATAAAAQTAPPPVPEPAREPAREPAAAPVPSTPSAPRHRSRGMMIAGIVLTTFAASALVTGVALLTCCHVSDPDGLVDRGVGGAAAAGFSLVPAAVGIPLWVAGALPPSAPTAASWRPLAPAVSVGLGSASVRWSF